MISQKILKVAKNSENANLNQLIKILYNNLTTLAPLIVFVFFVEFLANLFENPILGD